MAQVGYKLVETSNTDNVIRTWGAGYTGNTRSFIKPDFPNPLPLPDGKQVCGAQMYTDYFGYMVIDLEMEPPPEPIADISKRQFYQEAALEGIITQDEAIAVFSSGTIPEILQTVINSLPDAPTQFQARMLLVGANTFSRDHPMVTMIGTVLNKTSAEIDQFFLNAGQL